MSHIETIIIGAGPAGLAVAACLTRAARPFVLLERSAGVGSSWRHHYERLHLHTERRYSGLPHLPMPKEYPKYPSRDQVVAYLERYADHFGIEPRYGQTVRQVRACAAGDESAATARWIVHTQDTRFTANHVIIATGYNAVPHQPTFPDQALFGGAILHSSDYRSGADWAGKRALVVGSGNSGGEIAIDLVEHGAEVAWVVRGPVHVVPRDVFGRSSQGLAILLNRLPTRVIDYVVGPFQKLIVGDLSRWGIQRPAQGMYSMIRNEGRIPILDIGTIALMKQGKVRVVPGIERFTAAGVTFADGQTRDFDVVVMATGFKGGIAAILDDAERVTCSRGYPLVHGRESAMPGLYFIGYQNPASGNIREMTFEGERIAADIGASRPDRSGAAAAPATHRASTGS